MGRENFYIEVQNHEAPESPQIKLNALLYDLHRETGAPLLATNDLHYVAAGDADAQDVLLCVQTGKTLDEPKRMKFDSKEYYLKTADEMARLFPELPEALSNTMRVAEECNVEIEFGANLLPNYTIPAEFHVPGRVSVLALSARASRNATARSARRSRTSWTMSSAFSAPRASSPTS